MAYNNYFPATYQPYFNGYQQPMNVQQMQNAQQNQQPQIQNGGFVPTPSEEYARNYPVAPGNSVSFKDEKLPYLYTKTMGYSPLDRPVFEKFRLVKEEEFVPENAPKIEDKKTDIDLSQYALKADVEALAAKYDSLYDAVMKATEKPAEKVNKKGSKNDE